MQRPSNPPKIIKIGQPCLWTILHGFLRDKLLIGHRTQLKTKKDNFLVFQNFAVFLSKFIKTYILLNFILYYKNFLWRNHAFYHYTLWKMEKFFKLLFQPPPPPRYRYSRLAWLYIHKRCWHDKWGPVSRGTMSYTTFGTWGRGWRLQGIKMLYFWVIYAQYKYSFNNTVSPCVFSSIFSLK